MLSRLILKNYQIWRELNIELKPFTVIVGPSGGGKSSIYRAIHNLFRAVPGTDYVTTGQKKTDIELYFDDVVVRRSRSSRANTYQLDTEGIKTLFDKVGRDVPEELLPLFNAMVVKSEGESTDLFFADQHDPLLVLGTSSGRASRIFSSAIGIDSLDRALKAVRSDKRALIQSLRWQQQSLDELNEEFREEDWAEGLELFGLAQVTQQQVVSIQTELKEAQALQTPPIRMKCIPSLTSVDHIREINLQQSLLPEEPLVTKRVEAFRLDTLVEAYQGLTQIQEKITMHRNQAEDQSAKARALHQEYHILIGETCPLCGASL